MRFENSLIYTPRFGMYARQKGVVFWSTMKLSRFPITDIFCKKKNTRVFKNNLEFKLTV